MISVFSDLRFAPAGYWLSGSTTGIIFQKYVYSTFSMNMVLNCVHNWSVNFFLVKNKVPGRYLINVQYFEIGPVPIWACLVLLTFKTRRLRLKSVWSITQHGKILPESFFTHFKKKNFFW